LLGRGAHHLVEEVGGVQGQVDMLLDTPEVAEGPE
jgi:hypothetical protein